MREARAKNFFYGHSFTLSAGYMHSWLTTDKFDLTDKYYGRTGQFCNTRDSFDAFLSWDYCESRYWGVQVNGGYVQQGGQKLFYQDMGTGYGPQLRSDMTETIKLNDVELQLMGRCFLPLTYKSRLSFNAGVYLDRLAGGYDDANDWDFGAVVSLGYDWNHFVANVSYKPGLFQDVIKSSNTRAASISVNFGFRIWK